MKELKQDNKGFFDNEYISIRTTKDTIRKLKQLQGLTNAESLQVVIDRLVSSELEYPTLKVHQPQITAYAVNLKTFNSLNVISERTNKTKAKILQELVNNAVNDYDQIHND